MNTGKMMSMKPQAWYWRRAINGAQSLAEVQTYALTLVRELEAHKTALRGGRRRREVRAGCRR